ncbi:MAG: R3H domain-containing nucleic acid-binding protein [Candidatus Peribacteraceae bacterium]
MDASMIKDILGSLLKNLPFTVTEIVVTEEKDVTRVDLKSDDASRIIGWHGETLNAVQHLLKSIIRSKENLEKSPFIVVDIDGYRRSQEEKVCRIADQKADFVRRTGNRIALAPMSPYFRRIVHMYVANAPQLQDLTTESVGEGEYRQIVLRMKEEQSEELSPVMSEDAGLENLDV